MTELEREPTHSAMISEAELWQEYRARLRGYVAKRVRHNDAVDDILQDVFLKVHASLATVKSQDSIAAWLYRIAANAIADFYRSQKPSVDLPDELVAPEPERNVVGELAACLQPLIAELPERYQTALVLSEIQGLPQKEVAARLGLSLSGAKSRIQRGRDKLRDNLLACCNIETGKSGIVGYEPRTKKCGDDCS